MAHVSVDYNITDKNLAQATGYYGTEHFAFHLISQDGRQMSSLRPSSIAKAHNTANQLNKKEALKVKLQLKLQAKKAAAPTKSG